MDKLHKHRWHLVTTVPGNRNPDLPPVHKFVCDKCGASKLVEQKWKN